MLICQQILPYQSGLAAPPSVGTAKPATDNLARTCLSPTPYREFGSRFTPTENTPSFSVPLSEPKLRIFPFCATVNQNRIVPRLLF